ncbi:WxL domain-containing protein [Lacticaseibacillus jixiensis]|uniref:WxL domain-containing protein n=1 Tax=Lacticaseibacillus jixiensis TaxID=3231926 RepID=UPI0036F2E417
MKHFLIAAGALALAVTAYAATPAAAEAKDSTATVTIVDDPQAGQLQLASVPSFDFKAVTALSIYNGFTKNAIAASGDLKIIDGRPLDIPEGWNLTIKLGQFTAGANNTLATSTLSLHTPQDATLALAGELTSNGQTLSLASTNKRGTLTQAAGTISADLNQAATPDAQVKNGDLYTADLTWTLNAQTSPAPAL